MIQKANFLTITKGNDIQIIVIREDKKCFICFGDDNFFDIEKLNKLKKIKFKSPRIQKKYEGWINSKSFKKNFKETLEVINKSKNYNEITEKFIKDYKKDRGNRIIKNKIVLDTEKKINL